MTIHKREDRLLAERAAEWMHRLPDAGPQEQLEFIRWLRQSPKHVREMLLAMTWDNLLCHCTDPDHSIDVDALMLRSSSNVIRLCLSDDDASLDHSPPTLSV